MLILSSSPVAYDADGLTSCQRLQTSGVVIRCQDLGVESGGQGCGYQLLILRVLVVRCWNIDEHRSEALVISCPVTGE
jgi:hypothetical protein